MKRSIEKYKSWNKFTYGLDIEQVPNDIAERLNKEFKLGAAQVRYHVDGAWYCQIEEFPAVLFDRFGYLKLESYHELVAVAKISEQDYIHIDAGIHTLKTYVEYDHAPLVFTDFKMEIQKAEVRRKVIKAEEDKKRVHTISLGAIMQNAIKKAGVSNIIPVSMKKEE